MLELNWNFEIQNQNNILTQNLNHTDPTELTNFNDALAKITALNDELSETRTKINKLDAELKGLFPTETDVPKKDGPKEDDKENVPNEDDKENVPNEDDKEDGPNEDVPKKDGPNEEDHVK